MRLAIVQFAVHNERETRKVYPQIQHRNIKDIEYKFDTVENIESALNQIVEELYDIAVKNNAIIDEVFKK